MSKERTRAKHEKRAALRRQAVKREKFVDKLQRIVKGTRREN